IHRAPLEVPREMMESQAAHDAVEGVIGEGELLDWLDAEVNGDALPARLATRPRDHLRGGVNTHDAASSAYTAAQGEGQIAGAAGNVQDRIVGLYVSAVSDECPQTGDAPKREEPREQVIARGPMDEASFGRRRCDYVVGHGGAPFLRTRCSLANTMFYNLVCEAAEQ